MAKNKKFMYGIGEVRFGEKVIGYIEKGSWDWGGTKPEKTDVEAEQVPTAPVLTLMQKNGTISPTFNLIQLDYENLHLALGGTLVGTSGAYTGWKAPTSLVELRDKCEIDLVSRTDRAHAQCHADGEPRRQADADGSVEAGVPADREHAGRRRCAIRSVRYPGGSRRITYGRGCHQADTAGRG